jgi:hypothetical protein
MEQAFISMTQEDLKGKWEGVLSIERKEIFANTCWMKMDLKISFAVTLLVFELFGDCNLFWISPRTCISIV